jgi:predicted restriction endonuclease
MQTSLALYTTLFSSLHTNKQKGMPAPHKAVLLLSVIDMIEFGVLNSNEIVLSERLEQCFKSNWKKYVGRSVIFTPKIGTPFFHLHSEPFWSLVPFVGGEETIEMLRKGNPYATGTMNKYFRCAKIDKDLFELLKNEDARAKLRTTLITTYIQPQKRVIDTLVTLFLTSLLVS